MNWTGGRDFRGEVIRHGPGCTCSLCLEIDELDRQHKWRAIRGLFWGLLMVLVGLVLAGAVWHLFAKK